MLEAAGIRLAWWSTWTKLPDAAGVIRAMSSADRPGWMRCRCPWTPNPASPAHHAGPGRGLGQASSPVPEPAVTDYDRPRDPEVANSPTLAATLRTVLPDAVRRAGLRIKGPAPTTRLFGAALHPEIAEGPTLPVRHLDARRWPTRRTCNAAPEELPAAAAHLYLASIVHVPLHARRSPDPFGATRDADGARWAPLDLAADRALGLIYARTGSPCRAPTGIGTCRTLGSAPSGCTR